LDAGEARSVVTKVAILPYAGAKAVTFGADADAVEMPVAKITMVGLGFGRSATADLSA
jgi:hypothetical protein